MPYSIMLDAGHGGRDPGAVYNGRQEKDDALALTLAIGELLQERVFKNLWILWEIHIKIKSNRKGDPADSRSHLSHACR